MKVKALRTVNWDCKGTVYKCEAGKEIEISSADAEHAKASGIFEEIKEAPKAKKTTKKAE